jgi:alkylation response protein AidB-like acyl-CoA dehydrogenase
MDELLATDAAKTTLGAGLTTGAVGSPEELRAMFRDWLAANRHRLPDTEAPGIDYAQRLSLVRQVQGALHTAGWTGVGWSPDLGGAGGDARHRAVIYDELAAAGFATRAAFEHVEILAPALAQHWPAAVYRPHLQALLSGRHLWAQGFSEPDAGSDLNAIRTVAGRDGDGYRLTGSKIWTSWVGYAHRCVVLARTGAPEERHRGLSVFFVDLDQTGVDARALRQSNGLDELGEVTFDDVWVPSDRLIGREGGGWQITLDILSCERSSFAWLRQTKLLAAIDAIIDIAIEVDPSGLGDVLISLYALRASSERAVRALGDGTFLGPAAAPVKLLLTEAEQQLYDLAQRVLGPGLALGDHELDHVRSWQEEFLFSRVVSIYGGTRQMQLGTVSRFLLGLRDSATPARPRLVGDDDAWLTTARGTLGRDGGRSALPDLEWEPLGDLSDEHHRLAFAALFRAQGQVLANSPALGALVAHQLLRLDGETRPITAVTRASVVGDVVHAIALAGFDEAEEVLVELRGGADGPEIAIADRVAWEERQSSAGAFDPSVARTVQVRRDALRTLLSGEAALRRASMADALARLAVAHELLGVSDQLMEMAVSYGRDREQFGVSIGSFQAVAHLLADAEVRRRAVDDACHAALLRIGPEGPEAREMVLLKGLAGRTVRMVAQHTLQVFGAIGFTWEHPHHLYVRRGLTLDALFGSVEQMRVVAARDGARDGPLRSALAAGDR